MTNGQYSIIHQQLDELQDLANKMDCILNCAINSDDETEHNRLIDIAHNNLLCEVFTEIGTTRKVLIEFEQGTF